MILAGLALKLTGLDDALRSVAVIGWTMLIFGLVLYWADQRGCRRPAPPSAGRCRDAIDHGPLAGGGADPRHLALGHHDHRGPRARLRAHGAAKLSMLMSIPTILASGVVARRRGRGRSGRGRRPATAPSPPGSPSCAALGALALMMRLLRSVSFTPYVIYRVVLGVILLIYAYS